MPNLLDLMTDEDRQTVNKWAEERRHSKYKQDIPTSLYICAQLGHYYGWQAVVDARRGYHIGVDDDGKLVRLAFEYSDAVGLIKAAEKVEYRIMMDGGRINAATNLSVNDKRYARNNADYVNKLNDAVRD